MRSTYEEHRAKVENVREYIEVLKNIADIPSQHPEELASKELKSFVSMPQKRSYDYSLIIITLYGIFESYVEKMICAYLDTLKVQISSYNDLPEALRRSHIDLSTKLLGASSAKHGEIKPAEIIANLHSCLNQSSANYQLNVEAFRQHSSNFRKDTLREFFNQAGVDSIQNHIINDPALTSFIRTTMGDEESEAAVPASKYFEKLEDLVERRNVVAHGSKVDDLLSFDYLDEYAQYIYLLMSPIYDGLLEAFYTMAIKANTIDMLGTPIAVYDNKIVCINSSNFPIKVGHILIARNSEGKLKWSPIESIGVNGNFINEISPDQAIDIGMSVSFIAKKNYTYYRYPNISP